MIDNLPTVDDEELRKLNSKKVINMVDEIADNMRETKKTAKVTSLYLLIMVGIIILLVGGSYVALAIRAGSFEAFIEGTFNIENIDKRIICDYNGESMRFKSTEEAYRFKQVFGETSACNLITINKKAKE
jgi:hypothetical protein